MSYYVNFVLHVQILLSEVYAKSKKIAHISQWWRQIGAVLITIGSPPNF